MKQATSLRPRVHLFLSLYHDSLGLRLIALLARVLISLLVVLCAQMGDSEAGDAKRGPISETFDDFMKAFLTAVLRFAFGESKIHVLICPDEKSG